MEEKLRFVFEYSWTVDDRTLCQRYEITRETGYVWRRCYRLAGVDGLIEHSRAAHRHIATLNSVNSYKSVLNFPIFICNISIPRIPCHQLRQTQRFYATYR
jgi:hypothetical protein